MFSKQRIDYCTQRQNYLPYTVQLNSPAASFQKSKSSKLLRHDISITVLSREALYLKECFSCGKSVLVRQQDHLPWHAHVVSRQYRPYICLSIFCDERTSISPRSVSFLKTPHTTMRVCFFFVLVFCNHFCHLKEISFKRICGNLFPDVLDCFNDLISIIQGRWEEHGNRYLWNMWEISEHVW